MKHLTPKQRIALLLLVILLFASLAGCASNAAPTSAPAATTVPAATDEPKSALPEEVKGEEIEACGYEQRYNDDNVLEYRNSCGGGYYVMYSTAVFRGHQDDPGVMVAYVSVRHASAWWTPLQSNENWVAVFGTEDEARQAVCEAMNTLDPKRQLATGSEWILENNPCK